MKVTYLSNYSVVRFGNGAYREYTGVSQLSVERLKRVLYEMWREGDVVPGWVQGGATWLVIERGKK